MKKLTAYILLIASLLSAASCGGGGDNKTPDVTTPSDTTTAETEKLYADDLPEDLKLTGKTVTVLYRDEVGSEFFVESATGDVVDDAVYDSFRTVEDRLGVNIDVVLRPGHLVSARGEYMQHITSTILAGDSTYDWVDLMIGNAPTLMNEGIFLDLMDNKYIDLEKPYYLRGLSENCAIDGKLFFIAGDASLGYMKSAFCMYFNQRLVDEYKLGNLYDIVDSGEWTLDKVGEIAKTAAQDTNGDGNYDMEDKLGFVVHDWNFPKGLWVSTQSRMYSKDSDGEWKLTYGSERDADICNKIYNLFFATEGSYFPNITNAYAEHLEKYNQISSKFASGEILIITAELDDSVAQLRNMKDDYGILPCPKGDDSQENYYSAARNTHNSFSMPVTCADTEAAGAVIEALSSAKYKTVLPAYFETALKQKYARDNDSARMYDIIRDTMTLDFGYIYGNAIGGPEYVFKSSYSKENSFSSNLASSKQSLETALANYLEKLRESY